jgi:hypothetical protein
VVVLPLPERSPAMISVMKKGSQGKGNNYYAGYGGDRLLVGFVRVSLLTEKPKRI